MKTIILHNSGNVGKTLITREIFYSNFTSEDKKILEFETRNSSNSKFKFLKDDTIVNDNADMQLLTKTFLLNDDVVVDVGSSNIVKFLENLKLLADDGEIDDLDYIIIPIVPDAKMTDDTIKTIQVLKALKLDKYMRFIFNKYERFSEFKDFFDECKSKKVDINIDTRLSISYLPIIDDFNRNAITINELIKSDKDFKALAKEEYKKNNNELADRYVALHTLKKASKVLKDEFKNIFNIFNDKSFKLENISKVSK